MARIEKQRKNEEQLRAFGEKYALITSNKHLLTIGTPICQKGKYRTTRGLKKIIQKGAITDYNGSDTYEFTVYTFHTEVLRGFPNFDLEDKLCQE